MSAMCSTRSGGNENVQYDWLHKRYPYLIPYILLHCSFHSHKIFHNCVCSPSATTPLSIPAPYYLQDQRIGPPQFTIISLSVRDAAAVERNLQQKTLNTYYEASMVADTGKHKKVYCYLYPKVGVAASVPQSGCGYLCLGVAAYVLRWVWLANGCWRCVLMPICNW